MAHLGNKIGVIVVYFGKWPKWSDLYLETCSRQNNLYFKIFTNNKPAFNSTNIEYFNLSLNDFNALVKNKTGIPPDIKNAYKICDYKPLFGYLFEEYLKDFPYWAYSDIDLVFGDLSNVAKHVFSSDLDFYSGFPGFASGPFCIYKNNKRINELYTLAPTYKAIFENSRYIGFDEHIVKDSNIGASPRKLALLLAFLYRSTIKKELFRLNTKQLKYNFQWFVKRATTEQPIDITEVIYKQKRLAAINARFGKYVVNDSDYFRAGKAWDIAYINGDLTELNSQKKVGIFHFRELKNSPDFKMDDHLDIKDGFKINTKGILKYEE